MILPKQSDSVHKAWLYRLLSAIADDAFLTANLRFKGGTCASMMGIIDRFSIDLDFDLIDSAVVPEMRVCLEKIFKKLDLKIEDQSKKVPQYFLKYEGAGGGRNTLKLDITFPPPKNNEYEPVRFTEIDRIIHCQTVSSMFANKLVTVIERFEKFGSIAGRDIFDIHTFFMKGFRYKPEIIEERTGKTAPEFLKILSDFIEKKVTQTVIDQDLNTLLPPERFRKIRGVLKNEVLMFLRDEISSQ
ncbi:MAG: nucleotidyl transferase AbiEii/AbiGii toxin family protein [Candidatus Gracilibacteria bacterium]